MSKFNSKKINIENLKDELQNIINDYNGYGDSRDFNYNSDEFSASLEKENRVLSEEINNIKERIYDKLALLSGKNKFESIMNKFLEFYDQKNLNKNKLKDKFEKYVNKELATNDFSNLAISYEDDDYKNLNKDLTEAIEELFENQIKEIRKIQKNKAEYIDSIVYELNPYEVTHENVTKIVRNKLNQIKSDFKLDLNFVLSKHKNSKDNSDVVAFKENVLSLINDTVEELKDEFDEYVLFNKFLNQKIEAINQADTETFSKFSKDQIENEKYSSLENKISTLINSVENLSNQNINFESKTTELIDKRINELEEKFNKMLNTLTEQNESKISLEQENSDKIFDRLTDFFESIKSENNEFVLKTQKEISNIVKNNENEKKTIIDMLNKIQNEAINNNDIEAYNKSLINSNKLVQLEYLIKKQNDEIEELLKDKNDAFETIESILNNPNKQNQQELLENVQDNLTDIINNFENKISTLEQEFINKLEMLNNKETNGTSELIENINNVENRLIQNYETMKLNFSDSFNEIVNWLNNNKNSNIDNKIDELLSNVHDIKNNNQFPLGNDIKNELSNLLESNKNSLESALIESNRNIKTETNETINMRMQELESKFNSLIETINENNIHKINLDQENSDKLYSQISNLIETVKAEKNQFITETKQQISDVLESNENEKKAIIDLLKKIQQETIEANNAEAYNRSMLNSNKLVQLESLIMKQNDEINELLKEKNEAFDAIEHIINNPHSNDAEMVSHVETNVNEIISNFENKINSLEQAFISKLETLNKDSNGTNEIIENINNVESRLIQNYETIKLNFVDTFNEIINYVSGNKDNGLNAKIDELINDVNHIKYNNNNFALGNNIRDEINSLLESNKKSIENVLHKNKKNIENKTIRAIKKSMGELENKFNSLVEIINENNINKINLDQENSDKLRSEFDNLANTIKLEKNNFIAETKEQISNILLSNEKEKEIIVETLKKIQQEAINAKDTEAYNKSLINSNKLVQLESLIMKQNYEIDEILREKNEAFEVIESIINNPYVNEEELIAKVENNVSKIIGNFEDKITTLEQAFINKLDAINSKDSNGTNELIENINNVENKLMQNYESIRLNIADTFNEVVNYVNLNKDSGLSQKIDELMNDVSDIKYNSNHFALGNDIKDELNNLIESNKSALENVLNESKRIIEDKTINAINTRMNELDDKFNSFVETINEININKINIDQENSEKLRGEINNLTNVIRNEKDQFINDTKQQIFEIIISNENEKKAILEALNKIQQEAMNAKDTEAYNKSLINSNKLVQLESLIMKQNYEIDEILKEKNEAFEVIESIINNPYVNEEELIAKVENNVSKIIGNFEAKITNLEQAFINKLESINSNDTHATSELIENINNVETKLMQNYESIKLNIADTFNEVVNYVNLNKDSGLSQKIDELMNDVSDIKYNSNHFALGNDIKDELNSILESNKNALENAINESKRLIEDNTIATINTRMSELDDKLNSFVETINEININKLNIEQENSEKLRSEINNLTNVIRTEKDQFINDTKQQIFEVLLSNENEKKAILEALNKMQQEAMNAKDAEAYNRSVMNSNKLSLLETLIEKQNIEIEELLKEKNEAFEAIEAVINNPYVNEEELLSQVEENVSGIINNFETKITSLQEAFIQKLESIDSKDQMIIDNINNVEEKLTKNYETLKTNISDTFNEVVNLFNINNSDEISSKLDKLISDVDDIKYHNQFGLGNDIKNELTSIIENSQLSLSNRYNDLENKIISLVETFKESKNSDAFDSKMSKLEDKFNSLIETIKENNIDKLNFEQESQEKLYERIASLIESIKYDKNDLILETKQQINTIIMNNENEKKYILSILNKIQEDNQLANDEVALNRTLINSEKLKELENLIVRQNVELEELLNDKNEAFEAIESLLKDSTKNKNVTENDFKQIEENVLNVVNNLETKINELEKTFISKLEGINNSMSNSLSQAALTKNYEDNKTLNEIFNNISSVEHKLIQNYDAIKNNFAESFDEIFSKLNDTKVSLYNDKLDVLISEVDSLKNSGGFNQLGNELKIQLKELFSEELDSKLSGIIQKGNNELVFSKIDQIENKLNDLTEEIISRNKNDFMELSSKIDSIDYLTKTMAETMQVTESDYNDIESKLFENFRKYEEILVNTLNKDKENYNELKKMLEDNYLKREQELSENEFNKLQVLNSKLDKLASLIELQESEIETLIKEKNEVLSMLEQQNLSTPIKFDSNEIEHFSNLIEKKIDECVSRNTASPNNVTSIYKSDDYNELVQVNEKIDELSNYLHENMEFFKNKNSITDLLENDLFKSFANVDFLIEKVETITNEINQISIESINQNQQINVAQEKLDSLKFNLLSIEWDLSLLKQKLDITIKLQENNTPNKKDLFVINKKKLEIVSELIDRNKTSLENLYRNKRVYVEDIDSQIDLNKSLINNNDTENKDTLKGVDVIVEAKANLIVDKLVDKLKHTYNNEIDLLNTKFDNLENKAIKSMTDNDIVIQPINVDDSSIDSINEIAQKVELLEETLTEAFKVLEDKNKALLDEIEYLVAENDSYKKIINKFEEEKETIKQEYNEKIKSLKEHILSLKNDEINAYKSKLNKLEKEIEKLREVNLEYEIINNNKNVLIEEISKERDEAVDFKINRLIKYKEKIDSLGIQIEALLLQIDSFQEEKQAIFDLMFDKFQYLDKLNTPASEDEFIELETDNLSTEKFKDVIAKDVEQMIDEKFDVLRENITTDLHKIISDVNELKNNNYNLDDESQKMDKNSDYTLKLLNDNVLFFIDELEKRKKEISLFYEKIHNLRESIEE